MADVLLANSTVLSLGLSSSYAPCKPLPARLSWLLFNVLFLIMEKILLDTEKGHNCKFHRSDIHLFYNIGPY